jgi:hypothetical protein
MRFTPNHPVETREAKVVVDAGLPVGIHRFQLVVVNVRGQRSKPAQVVVEVVRQGRLPITPPIRR